MSDAVEQLARENRTNHPLLVAFIEAQRINAMSGGTVIAPWDIEPGHPLEEWTEAADKFSELPQIRSRMKVQADYLKRWRAEHKDYARRHYRN